MEINTQEYEELAILMREDVLKTLIQNGITHTDDILEYHESVIVPLMSFDFIKRPFDYPVRDSYVWMKKCKEEYEILYIENKNYAALNGLALTISPDKFFLFWIQYVLKFLNEIDYRPFWRIVPRDYDLKIYSYYRHRLRDENSEKSAFLDTWRSFDNRNPHTQGDSYNYGYFNGRMPLQITDGIENPTTKPFTNNFNSIESFEELKQHFIKLTKKSIHNNHPFLTEQQLDSFIYAAFQERHIEKRIIINYGQGELQIIVSIFYEFFRFCKRSLEYQTARKKDYVQLLSDYFSGFTYDQVFANFKTVYSNSTQKKQN